MIMALDVSKVNFLQQAMQPQQAQQARTVQPTAAVGPSFGQATGGEQASNNPFGKTPGIGVGLVNSNLKGMSYKLPNGAQSTCNTIGIA